MVMGPDGSGLFGAFNNSNADESHPIDAPYETFGVFIRVSSREFVKSNAGTRLSLNWTERNLHNSVVHNKPSKLILHASTRGWQTCTAWSKLISAMDRAVILHPIKLS